MALLNDLEIGRSTAGQFATQVPIRYTLSIQRAEKTLLEINFDVSAFATDATNPFRKVIAGDVLGVLPENKPEDVAKIKEYLQADDSSTYFLKKRYEDDEGSTYNEATALQLLALNPLKIETLQLLAQRLDAYEDIPAHLEAANQKLRAMLEVYQENPAKIKPLLKHQHLVDVLKNFPNLITLQEACDCQGANYRRVYTIAGIERNETGAPLTIQILAAGDVSYTVPEGGFEAGNDHFGKAIGYLRRQMEAGSTVNIFAQPRKFGAPEKQRVLLPKTKLFPDHAFLNKLKLPLLMVAAGSGVSGIRAILEERSYWKAQGYEVGVAKLIFGIHCRTKDFLCKEDWQKFEKIGILERVDLAESRPLQGSKKYVQHLLIQDRYRADLQAVAQQQAAIIICGDWRMGRSLLKAYLPFLLPLAQVAQLPEKLQERLHNPSHADVRQLFQIGLEQVEELRATRFIGASVSGSRHAKRKFSADEDFAFFLEELGWNQIRETLAKTDFPALA
ncbi:MAG: hypothetical protein AAGI49_19200 [Bacteroidota bacterium]